MSTNLNLAIYQIDDEVFVILPQMTNDNTDITLLEVIDLEGSTALASSHLSLILDDFLAHNIQNDKVPSELIYNTTTRLYGSEEAAFAAEDALRESFEGTTIMTRHGDLWGLSSVEDDLAHSITVIDQRMDNLHDQIMIGTHPADVSNRREALINQENLGPGLF